MTAFLVAIWRDPWLQASAATALTLMLVCVYATYPADVNYFAAVAGACLLAVTLRDGAADGVAHQSGSATRGSCCCVAADRCGMGLYMTVSLAMRFAVYRAGAASTPEIELSLPWHCRLACAGCRSSSW
ncbi:MAG: hypothetical protein R2856_25830 [Caldilineaceae bacterium]